MLAARCWRGEAIGGAGLLHNLLPSGTTDAKPDGLEGLGLEAPAFQRGYAAARSPVAGYIELSTSSWADSRRPESD